MLPFVVIDWFAMVRNSYYSDKLDDHSSVVNVMNYPAIDLFNFIHSFTCIVSTPTKSGKTDSIKKLSNIETY